jgi:hypothetical protein
MRTLFISILIIVAVSAFSQKTDTIIHVNGNILTGEIKRISYGIVTFKMDGMGTINYEIDKVQSIKSIKYFEIKLTNGLYYFGSFDTSNFKRKVNVVLSERIELIDIQSLTEVYPIKQNFWLRVYGKFDLGFDFKKGTGIGNLNFNGLLGFRKRKSNIELSWTNNTTAQKDTITSTKADLILNYQRYIKNKWSVGLRTGINENTELGLDLRAFLTASGIWDIIHNNRNRLYLETGLSANREWSNGDTIPVNNAEIILSTQYKLFKFTSPEIDITTNFTFYPNITTKGRLRLEYNLKSKIEVFHDFYIGLNYYYSFDSKPLSVTASNEDWGITTTFGYSFH